MCIQVLVELPKLPTKDTFYRIIHMLGSKLAILKEPKGFVQGVVYDPKDATFSVISTDRCLRTFSTSNYKCTINLNKINFTKENKENQYVRVKWPIKIE
jgi:hypothetical protein